ncbi:MAG TPA: hypothetical protein VFS43_22365 [Polyangiaceae bacterium]|nr:hypothetical protein [Polyangiaceae bacterium]
MKPHPASGPPQPAPGPFRAGQRRDGDRHALRRGRPVSGPPASPEIARCKALGGLCLTTDPLARDGGVDVGYALDEANLVAPHVSVGELGGGAGAWATRAPGLAVEYVGPGRDEADLQRTIAQLLGAGTAWVWAVRLTGPRRVEVYEQGRPRRIKRPGARLAAPGVLKNPPPVEALYERAAAFEHAARNLLERQGHAGVDALRAEGEARGEARGRARAVLATLEARGVATTGSERARILDCGDLEQLECWTRQALTARSAGQLFVPQRRAPKARR